MSRSGWLNCLAKAGETVGFRMRAETCVGPQTRPEVVTEDPDAHDPARSRADGRGLVILDEFHERSLQADSGPAARRPAGVT